MYMHIREQTQTYTYFRLFRSQQYSVHIHSTGPSLGSLVTYYRYLNITQCTYTVQGLLQALSPQCTYTVQGILYRLLVQSTQYMAFFRLFSDVLQRYQQNTVHIHSTGPFLGFFVSYYRDINSTQCTYTVQGLRQDCW